MNAPHEENQVPVLRYPEGSAFEAEGLLPAYTGLMSLEELGLLYLLEHCRAISREAAYRLAAARGIERGDAQEIIDFYFMRHGASIERSATVIALHPAAEDIKGKAAPARKAASSARPRIADTLRLGDADEEVATLPIKDAEGKCLSVRADYLARLEQAFPGIDIQLELSRASVWLDANPGKRKTARGLPRFINGWLTSCAQRKSILQAVSGAEKEHKSGFGVTTAPAAAHVAPSDPQDDGLGDILDGLADASDGSEQ